MKIERQLQGTLNTVFSDLIKERGLDKRLSPFVTQEEGRADVTLKNSNGKPIFFIELKDPTAHDGKSVFDGNILMRETGRAQKLGIDYFGNCNFLACAFFDTKKLYEKQSVSDGFFTLTDIVRLGNNYSPNKDIENKLKSIAGFYLDRAVEIIDKKPVTFTSPDELFIFRIRKLIEGYAYPVADKVWEKYRHDKQFERAIGQYTQSQLWNKPSTYEEIENLSHIALLMLISKLIFYKTYVDNQTYHALHPMKVSDDIKTPKALEKLIWQYFEEFKEITGNFELLIGERHDIIFQIPFVSEAVVDLVKDVLSAGEHYNFGNIPFDVIGRIFEELIREDERHKLGQYFTPPHVIDLINAFAIRKANDKVFDPSCGSGTFLVRAYERKKNLYKEEDKGVQHDVLLNEIYGNDLSGYPAYLSMLNLAIRNTRKASYPRIVNKDFFAITATGSVNTHDQKGNLEKKQLPKFDAIVGNPPYTRQEDIGTMYGTQSKEKVQMLIKTECSFEPSARTGIYAYFFYHASVFLKDGGYLAYICQNSWLDTDYGIDMQRYLLRNYEIVAIMDSEVERFFPSASVNTTIVILRKERNESVRENNLVKFVYLKQPLTEIIKKYKGIENLKEYINETVQAHDYDDFRLTPVKQSELINHTKWSQFLKAPKVYFDILYKGKDKFVPLSKCAEINFGIKTGCNDFFIVKDITSIAKEAHVKAAVNNSNEFETAKEVKHENLRLVENGFNELWLVEERYLQPMLTSPRDVNSYSVKSAVLPYSVLIINEEKKDLRKDAPYLLKYIQHAEKQNIHTASSLDARRLWYSLGDKKLPDMSFNYIVNEFGRTFLVKANSNNNFHNIYANKNAKTIWLYMNSTISWLLQQLIMRSNLGDGAGKIETYELAAFPFVKNLDLEKLNVNIGETRNFKQELGVLNAYTLKEMEEHNPERVKLDSAILEAIGFNEKQTRGVLHELYQATYKLIDARLQKAQSMKGVKAQRNKVEFSVYVEQLKQLLLEEKIPAKNTLTFAKQCEKLVRQVSSESKLQKKILDTYWKEKFGERFDEKEIGDKAQVKMF